MGKLYLGLAIAALTALSFFCFPGHTYLQSDTQIYLPILERFWDPSVLDKDIVATRPHVAFTIYDEIALAARHLTGLDFQPILVTQQVIFRALGIFGVYLVATAAALPPIYALVVASVYALGATIVGPAVLTIEYEPVPRGFAIPLLLLAVGLSAHGRLLAAAVAGALASMYHPPTVYPFALVFLYVTARRRDWRAMLVFLAGPVLLLASSRVQMGMLETQMFFSRVSPAIEQLQRFRASYNWIGQWYRNVFWHYVLLTLAVALAWWRTRKHLRGELQRFVIGLPAIGVLSAPASYLLLDKWKWALMPQLQPARALLFVVLMAVILGAIAGLHAAERRRWPEAALWFAFVLSIPAHPLYLELLFPDIGNPLMRTRLAVVVTLTLLLMAALWLRFRSVRLRNGALAAWMVLPFLAIPYLGKTTNYPALHTQELDELAAWARSATNSDDLFLFPDARRDLAPGVFRARAVRSLYVDWKGGGQVNFIQNFAEEWWERWQNMLAGGFRPARLERFKEVGIRYIVLPKQTRIPELTPVYENSGYLVYRIS